MKPATSSSSARLPYVVPNRRISFEERWPIEPPLPDELRARICCILPCYNVGRLCVDVIRQVTPHVGRIVAVNDGSTDDTSSHLAQAAADCGIAEVISHQPNRGKGIALFRGFEHALRTTCCDVFLTIDGDGQHRAGDIPRIARPCLQGVADLVMGQRQFPPSTPARSRVGNFLSVAVLSTVYRKCPRDTQCGLRSLTRPHVELMLRDLVPNRYETETRIMIRSLFLRKRITLVPIPAIYIGNNDSSHYRALPDSLRIFRAFFEEGAFPEMGIPLSWKQCSISEWFTPRRRPTK